METDKEKIARLENAVRLLTSLVVKLADGRKGQISNSEICAVARAMDAKKFH